MGWSLAKQFPFFIRTPKKRKSFYSCLTRSSPQMATQTSIDHAGVADNDDFDSSSDTSPPARSSSAANYSNFYLKLPDGRYLVRMRTVDRVTIGTYVVEGHMI
ncbi:hypothetical protein BX666DRAFT_378894 [Dichotomocladium elegans]|nr:hypothetical protein BX666DRAFT_378894 [Dichotomocladium elegans]